MLCPSPVPATPPEREWIALEDDVNFSQGAGTFVKSSDSHKSPTISILNLPLLLDTFIILSYNVLCEKYAPSSSYQYCPSWALDWTYRKEQIVQEITAYGADIICLQEIEMGQFEEFFQPQLRNSDYEGVFFPKSRARTMNEVERRAVDGCATFWKTSKWVSLEALSGMSVVANPFGCPQVFAHRETLDRVPTYSDGTTRVPKVGRHV